MSDTGSLQGKRVLITGAAGGVGRSTAWRMLQAGARLLLTDWDPAELHRVAASLGGLEGGVPMVAFAADLTSSSGVSEVFEHVDAELGGLDMLVSCAAIGSGPLQEMDEPGWRRVIETNLMATVACAHHALPRIAAAGSDGMLILVGSISVHIKAVGESVYNASKGGVALFAETLRKELMRTGVRVTLIEPGAIATALQPFSAEQREQFVVEQQMLHPDEVADAILFAATRPPGVDVVTLRIEPMVQKIY